MVYRRTLQPLPQREEPRLRSSTSLLAGYAAPVTSPLATTSPSPSTPQDDFQRCHAILAVGSKSFAAASKLLPSRLRDPAAAFYAFCRVADDRVDDSGDPKGAVRYLNQRLDAIYNGRELSDPIERAMASVVQQHGIPRVWLDALIEGFAWDASERVYESESDVLAYAARVASTVGLVMTAFMTELDRHTLARATELGLAMQLTNIARDVAEDAERGRLYLPAQWLREEGIDPEAFLRAPRFDPALARVIQRLLDRADTLYLRSEAGISRLPADCRPAIMAARLIYADIGRLLQRRGYNPLAGRVSTSKLRKLWLLIRARLRPTPPQDHTKETLPPQEECRFLLADFPEP